MTVINLTALPLIDGAISASRLNAVSFSVSLGHASTCFPWGSCAGGCACGTLHVMGALAQCLLGQSIHAPLLAGICASYPAKSLGADFGLWASAAGVRMRGSDKRCLSWVLLFSFLPIISQIW